MLSLSIKTETKSIKIEFVLRSEPPHLYNLSSLNSCPMWIFLEFFVPLLVKHQEPKDNNIVHS